MTSLFSSVHDMKIHRTRGQYRDVKKCKAKLRAPSRASKWAPTWHSHHRLSQNPFLASLIQTQCRGWPLRGFEVVVQLCHMRARFEALNESVVRAPSISSCIFFTVPTLLSEQCGQCTLSLFCAPMHCMKWLEGGWPYYLRARPFSVLLVVV